MPFVMQGSDPDTYLVLSQGSDWDPIFFLSVQCRLGRQKYPARAYFSSVLVDYFSIGEL